MSEINLEIINQLKEQMQDNFTMLLQYFIEDTAGYISEIKSAIESGDIKKIKDPAHTIKSSAKLVGALKVSDIAMAIEMQAHNFIENNKNNNQPTQDQKAVIAQIQPLFNELEQAFSKAEPELKSLI